MKFTRLDGHVRLATYGGGPMATEDFQQVLAAARRLSKSSRVKLVSALLQEPDEAHTSALEPLTGLSEAELCSLAASVFAPAHARRLQQILRLHREKKLTRALQAELDALLEESDRIALVKAKANYTLNLLKA